jgi:hypothetical protein
MNAMRWWFYSGNAIERWLKRFAFAFATGILVKLAFEWGQLRSGHKSLPAMLAEAAFLACVLSFTLLSAIERKPN